MRNDGYVYEDRVGARDAGLSPAEFYAGRYRHSPLALWQERVADGQVFRNGRAATAADRLRPGDCLAYRRPPWDEPDVPTDFSVLFEDGNVLVLAKPSGLPVLPGGGFLENTLLALVRRRHGDLCSPLHRLGRGTSGAILFTRTAASAARLGTAMAERRIRKTYLALAEGTGLPDRFTVDTPIGPRPHPLLGAVHAACPGGRPSLSHVTVLRRGQAAGATLVQVEIPTGRPHQIRIHLACAGFPLRGDPLYGPGGIPRTEDGGQGRAAIPGDGGYLLHSWKIRYPDPETGAEREVVCPPPAALTPP